MKISLTLYQTVIHNDLQMKKIILAMAMMLAAISATAQNSVYRHKVKDAEGREVSLREYKGQVLLIVNTATHCGFTPQYTELEALYQKYKDKGFTVLDFPCNQFGAQAPGSNEEIRNFCTSNYDIHFPQFGKIDVNGENASPLFVFLKSKKGFLSFGTGARAQRMDQMLRKKDARYDKKPDIKWNFTKFLIDRRGRVVSRFEPTQDIQEVEKAIVKLLK